MPYKPKEIEQDQPDGPYFVQTDDGVYTVQDESAVDASVQLDDSESEDFSEEAGQRKAFTIISRGSGRAKIRSNVELQVYVKSIFIPGGAVAGTIPPGMTFEGRDANNNGIPDAFEDIVRRKYVSWSNPF